MVTLGKVKQTMHRIFNLVILSVLTITILACGNSVDESTSSGPTIIGEGWTNSDAALTEETSKGIGVIGAPGNQTEADPKATSISPTPTTVALATVAPTSTPPNKTVDEKITGKLVDVLSSDQYPRTNARNLEREFRREPETAKEKLGKSFLVQGDVLIAGANDANEKFVTFKAGKGQVTCIFANITDAELLRFTPAGTNSVTGTVESWDSENRILTLTDCNVVLGY